MKRKDRGHARFSPSGSSRWIQCPGSIPFVESLHIKPWTSEPAELGTATHTLLELALRGRCSPHKFINKRVHTKYKVTKAMANSAEAATDIILPMFEIADACGTEDQHDIPATGQWGTVDAWALSMVLFQLDIWDFKNGKHPVSAYKNPQMRLYALGAYHATRHIHRGANISVAVHIVQPNAFSVQDEVDRTWRTTARDNERWANSFVVPAVRAVNNNVARRIPGEHCKGCQGAARCPELAKAAASAARMDFAELITPKKGKK